MINLKHKILRLVGLGNSGPAADDHAAVASRAAASGDRHFGVPCALALNDGWMDIAWPGEWQHWMGWTQKIEAEDLQTMLASFNTIRQAEGEAFAGFALYGGGHPEVSDTQSDEAFGWFTGARIQGGRLQFQVEMNTAGRQAIAEKRWKFISPYFYGDFDDAGYYRPAYVDNACMTNRPVMRKGQKPLANAEKTEPVQDAANPPETPENAADGRREAFIADIVQTMGVPNSVSGDIQAWIAELIGETTDKDEALQKIYSEWRKAYDRIESLNAAETLVYQLANSLGISQGEDGSIDREAILPAANAAMEEKARLQLAYRQAVVDRAVDRGAVPCTDEGRQQALRRIADEPEAAVAAWFARPAAPANPPASPLANVALPCAAPTIAADRVPDREQTAAINAAADKRQKACGCSREAAFDWAWTEFQHQRIA